MERRVCFVSVIVVFFSCTYAYEVVTPYHYKISDFIFSRYNADLVPKRTQNESVKVFFSMELYQIIEVNEPQQYLMLNAWIVERWVDKLLYWSPEEYGNTTEVMVPHTMLWLPDTTLYNSLVMEDRDTRRLLNAKLTSIKDGAYVELLYPTIYKLSCNLDLRFFPFDIQVCKMIFGSWTFDNTYIDYFPFNISHAIGTSNCIENEGWNVLGTSVTRRVEKYACCPNNYTLLDFYLHVQRKPLYYVINLITPTSIITLISIVGFFSCSSINELREEKISLGITTLLSMSILIFMVSDKMPSTSSFIPLIGELFISCALGWFYTCMILLISMSTLCSSVIIYIQKQGILGKPPAKKTMRYARIVGRFVRMELPLLMKQAYAQKAREDRFRKQTKRKESLWQKMYKLSKVGLDKERESASQPRHLNVQEMTDDGGSTPLPIRPKKCLAISQDVIRINGSNGGIQEYNPMPDIDADEDTSYIDEDKDTDEYPPSKFLHKTSTCQSLESAYRLGVTIDPATPRTVRNLAELEYDWLAAVIERVCLIFFIICFIIASFGINSIGLYYWWTAGVER